jgi:XTP/dITP diphosphohydrolase
VVQSMMEVVFGTANPGKLKDVNNILASTSLRVKSLRDVELKPFDIPETGTTFEENAVIKFNALRPLIPLDDILVTEDTGIEIDALGGRPGVYSRRWDAEGEEMSDEQILQKVLKEMKGKKDRTARFISVIAFGAAGPTPRLIRGELVGELLEIPDMKGFEPGLPYRALFYIPSIGKMLYEMQDVTPSERQGLLTHREKVWLNLVEKLI